MAQATPYWMNNRMIHALQFNGYFGSFAVLKNLTRARGAVSSTSESGTSSVASELRASPTESRSAVEPALRAASRTLPRNLNGAAAEFETLSMPLANALFATAYRMTGNTARAEDLVQETYVLAWQKFNDFKRGTNFKAWVFRILILTSRNEGRDHRKQPAGLSEEATQTLAQPEVRGEPSTAAGTGIPKYEEFLDDDFKQALDRLDADHRAVLMLVTLGELTYQECSEALALPLGTVMSRLYRARKQLQGDLYQYARDRGIIRASGPDNKMGRAL